VDGARKRPLGKSRALPGMIIFQYAARIAGFCQFVFVCYLSVKVKAIPFRPSEELKYRSAWRVVLASRETIGSNDGLGLNNFSEN
jgi:hypothetical protein